MRRVAACAWLLAAMPALASTPTPEDQASTLARFAECLHEIPKVVSVTFTSSCSGEDATPLLGLARADVRAALGVPARCADATDAIMNWSEADCAAARTWSYAYYRLPRELRGLGPALEIRFGPGDTVADVTWVIHSDAIT